MTAQVSCEEVIEKLFEFLDRELDNAAQHEIERHLEACRGCFTRAEFERRLRARVAETATVKAPESLRRRVRSLVARY
jgi:anti-sigma factor (TIGR02949 family)